MLLSRGSSGRLTGGMIKVPASLSICGRRLKNPEPRLGSPQVTMAGFALFFANPVRSEQGEAAPLAAKAGRGSLTTPIASATARGPLGATERPSQFQGSRVGKRADTGVRLCLSWRYYPYWKP